MTFCSWNHLGEEVHVWSVSLARSGEELVHLREILSQDERDRACRYLHQPSRQQFIAARAFLRLILGRYLGVEPSRVMFQHSNTGKPILCGGGIHFNISHSHQLALIGITRLGEIGVDVEHVRSVTTFLDMAERYFTPGESAALKRLPPGAREQAFYHIWTRKEAFLKAIGLGLSHGLERFEVSVPPDDPARILHIDGDRSAGARWSMTCLEPLPGYVGAIAIESHQSPVRLTHYEE
ncbi:MAG: 4'-phosphopantetheinyl transferase superfamily protein [Gemmataceae bacterium]